MNKTNRLSENGQSLVVVALMLVILIGILALVLDGGNAWLKRRQAQTAADGGALAGARALCLGSPDVRTPIELAEDYAALNIHSDLPPTIVATQIGARMMRVEASIPFETFFGNIFGLDQITAAAVAEAGCYSPTYGEGVLPIVWSCRAPVEGLSDSESCQQQRIDEDTLNNYLQTPNIIQDEMYVVMDSESLNQDLLCSQDDPAGILNCDFDDPPDGESDWLAGGSRSWIDLDGTNDANDCPGKGGGSGELVDWILNGYDCEIGEHTWIPTQTGNLGNVFQAAWCRRLPKTVVDANCPNKHGLGKPLVLIPVNDSFCKDGDPRVFCSSGANDRWHEDEPDLINEGAQNQTHYHIQTFAAFYITCVRLSQNSPQGSCPGIERALELNPTAFVGNDYKSIEGYFLEGYFSGLGGKGDPNLDTGVYTIFLNR